MSCYIFFVLYLGAKLIAQLNRWPAGVVILALCVLMRRGCIPAARVITALPPAPHSDEIAAVVIKIGD